MDLYLSIPVLRLDDLEGNHADLLGDLRESPSDKSLDRGDGSLGVGHGLPLGDLTDQAFSLSVPGDHRRRGASALLVGDDNRILSLNNGHDAVGRSQVYSYCLSHT
jgi:hypothetical protein